MKKTNIRRVFLAACFFVLLFLTSCSCGCSGNTKPLTMYANETTEKNTIEWVNTKLIVNPLQENYKEGQLSLEKLAGTWQTSETVTDVKKTYTLVVKQDGTGTIKINEEEYTATYFIKEITVEENTTNVFVVKYNDKELLLKAGFNDICIYGDYSRTPYTEGSVTPKTAEMAAGSATPFSFSSLVRR